MKVGKEEMIGLTTAIELCVRQVPDPVFEASERNLRLIASTLARLPGVSTEFFEPPVSYRAPHLRIQWDEASRKLSAEQVRYKLLHGSPRIITRDGPDPVTGVEITAWMVSNDDIPILTRRLVEILS